MKTAILYASFGIKEQRGTQSVLAPDGTPIFIRVEIRGVDALRALDVAKPRENEIVLNSIEFPE